MTKAAFLAWLDQFRRVDHIRQLIETRLWTDEELDRLQASLIKQGRFKMKNRYRERMAWG